MFEGDRRSGWSLEFGAELVCRLADEFDSLVVTVPGGVIVVVPRTDRGEPLTDGFTSIRAGEGCSEGSEKSGRSRHAVLLADIPVIAELREAKDASSVRGLGAVCESHEGDLIRSVGQC